MAKNRSPNHLDSNETEFPKSHIAFVRVFFRIPLTNELLDNHLRCAHKEEETKEGFQRTTSSPRYQTSVLLPQLQCYQGPRHLQKQRLVHPLLHPAVPGE